MDIAANLKRIRDRMAQACLRAGRGRGDVTLIAVTKSVDAATTQAVIEAGVRHIAENRQQDADDKLPRVPALQHSKRPLLHFIGPLQRNKVKRVLQRFDVIHSVDSLELAQEIGKRCLELGREVGVFIEVNVADEAQKHGFDPAASDDVRQIRDIKGVHVLGLMCMAPYGDDPEAARPHFMRLAQISRQWREQDILPVSADHLSMGMSGDFEVAIEEGATHIRVGSALFE